MKKINIFSEEDYGKTIFNSKNSGSFIINGKTNIKICSTFAYSITFIETKTTKNVLKTCIETGNIKDEFFKRIYGVGYVGLGENSYTKNTKEYTCWQGMLRRCYDKVSLTQRDTYVDCTVCERWHNFQNFCEDIKELENYEKWILNEEKYSLDKDIISSENTVYCKEKCMFVTLSENSLESCNRNISIKLTGKEYTAIRIQDNYSENFHNMSEFARKYNLQPQNIRKVLSGDRKIHKGWIFSTNQ